LSRSDLIDPAPIVRSTSSGAVIGALRQLRDRRRAEFPHAAGGTIDGVEYGRDAGFLVISTIIWRRQKSGNFEARCLRATRAATDTSAIAGSTPDGQFSRDLAGNRRRRSPSIHNNDLSIRLPIRSSLNQFYQNPFQQGLRDRARPPRPAVGQ